MLTMRHILLLLVATIFATFSLHAQKCNINGRVTDSKGEPLVAVTVYEEGAPTVGTVTDIDGNYSLSVSSSRSVIVFTCLGFVEVKENVGSRTIINVTLQDEALSIDAAEVVSVGYGTLSRRDLTGSVSKVEMDNVLKTPSANFDQALTGRIAGVVVTTSDGSLGAEANITIRGNNSLTQSSAPLYVIDGFPSESSMAASINSADIQSIDILKDASATAIYGARGANGVIVITTKSGTEGKPKINFSSSWALNKVTNKMKMMDGYEYVKLQCEIADIKNYDNKWLKPTDEDLAAGIESYTLEDYRNVSYTDWQDAIYRIGFVQNYNVSVSGGSKQIGNRYNVSFSATDQDGVIVNSGFQKYSGKLNFHQKFGKNVELNLLATYSHSVINGVTPTEAQNSSKASGWLMYSVWGYRPVKSIRSGGNENLEDALFDDEIDSSNDYRFNPAKTVRNEYRKKITDYLNANANLTWDITEHLKLKISGGYTMNKKRHEAFNGSQTYSGNERSASGKGVNGSVEWMDKVSWINENTLTWDKKIRRNHKLTLMGGFTLQGDDYKYQGTKAIQLTTESLGIAGLHTGNYQVITPYFYDCMLISGLFRMNYSYKYKYYLTASFRADGSSKFPKGNKWGYFPSVGLSWNFNREQALKYLSWLSNGKLRASWGMTGNNRTGTPYDYYSQMTTTPGSESSFDYVFGGNRIPGYYPIQLGNTDLKWETTLQWNVGLDVSFLDSRIKLTADWYLKDTRDLLLMATVPASSGYDEAMLNVGSMRNQGVEFTMDFVPIRTDKVEWNLNFNIAANRNTVTALNDGQYSLKRTVSWDNTFDSQYAYITQVGKPSGMMYGYVYDGTYKYADFDADGKLKSEIACLSSLERGNIQPGDPKYRDVNRDGVVDENDKSIIGYGQPLFTGGFGSTVNFYNFDFSVFFSYSYGNDILNANRIYFESGRSQTNQFESYVHRWTPDNSESDIPRAQASDVFVYSSRVVEDGSFLKLRNISLGYTLPEKVMRRIKFDTMRVYVSADNILTFTKYTGPDPEVSVKSSVLTPGFDWSAYPRAFGLTAGLSFTF